MKTNSECRSKQPANAAGRPIRGSGASTRFPFRSIGAPARGARAGNHFLRQVPAGGGTAFVIVQHVERPGEGSMDEPLQNYFGKKVIRVEDCTRLEPNCVYVIPSNKDISIRHGVLHFLERTERRVEDLAITNSELRREIERRQAVEESLRKSGHQPGRLSSQSRRMHEQLLQLSRQVLEAQEAERKKISRELHDVVAQTLTGINLRLGNLKAKASISTKGLERAIAQIQQLVEHSVKIVHEFARALRPAMLDDLGLIPALHAFMKGFKEETGIHVSLSTFAAIEQVSAEKRTVLYRVVQEALTNVARHANASEVEVKIQKSDGAVCLEISDNGKGFETKRVLRSKGQKRLGLLGMSERVQMVGGTFRIDSSRGKGTIVRANMPLGNEAVLQGSMNAKL